MVEVVVGVSRQVMDRAKLAAYYAEGGRRATALMRRTIEGKKCEGLPLFDGELVKRINSEVLFYANTAVKGKFRDPSDYSTEVDTEAAVTGKEIPVRFYLYSRWLREAAKTVCMGTDNILTALRVAAEAHYGLTGPQLHPFADGNGRTARVLVNGLLMLGSRELQAYGYAIPPVPILRNPLTAKGRIDPYVVALQDVRKTRTVNPLEKYIAERWVQNISSGLCCIKSKVKKPSRYDLELIGQFEQRKRDLKKFIESEDHRSGDPNLIPNYFSA